jgi:hypothetical protein
MIPRGPPPRNRARRGDRPARPVSRLTYKSARQLRKGGGPTDCYRLQRCAVTTGTFWFTTGFLGVSFTGDDWPGLICCGRTPAAPLFTAPETVIVPPLQETVFPSTKTAWPSSIGMS